MRKTIYMFSFLITMATIVSCGNAIKDAEGVGKHAFNALTKINDVDLDGYAKNFISLSTYKEILKATTKDLDAEVSKKMMEQIDKFGEKEYKQKLEQGLNRIKKDGEKLEIDWSNIEYKNFDFEEKDRNGIKDISGDVVFSQGDKTYKISVSGANFNGNFYLGQMGYIREAK